MGLAFAQGNPATLGTPGLSGDMKIAKLVVSFDKGEGVGKITKNKNIILLDIVPATLSAAGQETPFANMLVSKIKTEQYDKTVARITLTCVKECDYTISNEKNRIMLTLKIAAVAAVKEAVKKTPDTSASMEKIANAATEAVAKSETSSGTSEFGMGNLRGRKGNIDQMVDHINTLNADLPSLLNMLCSEAGFNLITSKSVAGTIPSIQLNNVSLKKILDLILKQNGFTYKVEGNIIRVATAAEMKMETEDSLIETRSFPISFAKATILMGTVTPMLSSVGKIQADARTNSLLVTDISLKLDEVAEILRKLDTQTKQVQIEAKLVDVKCETEDKLGIRWDLESGGLTAPTGSDIYPPAGNLVYRGSVAPPQTSAARAGSLQFGIAGSTTFWISLEALIKNNDANLLANPRITTLDNVSATMNISQAYTYLSSYNNQTGISSYSSVDAGVSLQVLPQINRNGFITLQVQPQVSSIVSAGPPPVVDSRSANTTVLVKDGETLIIGGMIREDEVVTSAKVPILGDIPLLGPLLFQSKDVQKTKRNLMVFITPKIIE